MTWEWRDDGREAAKQQLGMGVIAQDVEKVFAGLVATDQDGLKMMDYYTGLIGPPIESFKELDARLAALENRLEITNLIRPRKCPNGQRCWFRVGIHDPPHAPLLDTGQ